MPCFAEHHGMAALISGVTLHAWGKIPVNVQDALMKAAHKSSAGDADEFYERCLSMRWLILDEMSTLSSNVLGLLKTYLRKACRRHPHSKRSDGSWRPFGGLNIIFLGRLVAIGTCA